MEEKEKKSRDAQKKPDLRVRKTKRAIYNALMELLKKKNLENIEKPNSQVKALIFKQAIALGWDCPRAQVMAMLRDTKSEVFRIQTVGRILRMPEAKHYADDALNKAYVYTDLQDVSIAPDDTDAKKYVKCASAEKPVSTIKGDAFAPRNPHALKIDFEEEPPYFKVSDTHYAKTWLLDPRAPKLEKPEVIQNLHEKIER